MLFALKLQNNGTPFRYHTEINAFPTNNGSVFRYTTNRYSSSGAIEQ